MMKRNEWTGGALQRAPPAWLYGQFGKEMQSKEKGKEEEEKEQEKEKKEKEKAKEKEKEKVGGISF